MKKLLLGSISLLVFSLAIAVVDISCQKSVAQTSTTLPSQHLLLYHTTTYQPVEYVVSPDTASTKETRTENYGTNTYYVSNLNGDNEKTIPVAIPQGMYSGDYAKLTDDGTTLVFSLYKITTPPTQHSNSIFSYSIYSCLLDGSNAKLVKEGLTLDDVH